jgi:hypothetical protein
MAQCETVVLLQQLVAENGEWTSLAAPCLDLVENIEQSGLEPAAIGYLHLFVSEIYKAGDLSILDHLTNGVADCDICRELVSYMNAIPQA